jgi:hypothetical protein
MGDGSSACVVQDPAAHFTPGALAGRRLFARSEVGATQHFAIASNTAASITLGQCMSAPPEAALLYHVGGTSGGSPPDWDRIAPGSSTRIWGVSERQGFTSVAGSNVVQVGPDIYDRIAVGDYVMIPNADRLGRQIVLPAPLTARVEARLGGDRLTLSRPAGASQAYAPGYWGAPLADHQISYIDLDFDAFSGAMAVINSSAAAGRASRLGTVLNYQSARSDWRRTGEPPPYGLGDHQFAGPVSRLLPRPLAYAPVIDLTAALAAGDDLALRPTGDALLNAPAPPPAAAREVTLQIESAGGPRRLISFGAHFRSAGPLSVEAPAGAVYVVRFVSDGASWNEASRSGPLVAGGGGGR